MGIFLHSSPREPFSLAGGVMSSATWKGGIWNSQEELQELSCVSSLRNIHLRSEGGWACPKLWDHCISVLLCHIPETLEYSDFLSSGVVLPVALPSHAGVRSEHHSEQVNTASNQSMAKGPQRHWEGKLPACVPGACQGTQLNTGNCPVCKLICLFIYLF